VPAELEVYVPVLRKIQPYQPILGTWHQIVWLRVVNLMETGGIIELSGLHSLIVDLCVERVCCDILKALE